MLEKIKIRGLGNMELLSGTPEVGKDYLVSIRCSRSGVEDNEEDIENPVRMYVMKYLATEQFQEIGSSKVLKTEKGKTQSQKLRWTIYDLAAKLGVEPEEFYQKEMSKIIEQEKQKLD